MAKTLTKSFLDATDRMRVQHLSYTLDNSYATGGYALTPAELGLVSIERVMAEVIAVGTHFVVWDEANSKLMVFVAAGTQVTNATDLSAIKIRVTVYGY